MRAVMGRLLLVLVGVVIVIAVPLILHSRGETVPGMMGRPTLEIRDEADIWRDDGTRHIGGEVRNNAQRAILLVYVDLTVYDKDGNVIMKHTAYTNPSDLLIGESGDFRFIVPNEPGWDHYELEVVGME